MFREHTDITMGGSYSERQEHYIRVMLSTNKNEDMQNLRKDKDLAKRVTDICAKFVQEIMPEEVTFDSYEKYRTSSPQKQLRERLMKDEHVRAYLSKLDLPNIIEVGCDQLAHLVCETHRYFLHKTLNGTRQNTSQ